MARTPHPTYRVQRRFVDFDQLGEEARQWDLDLRQLDRGSFRGELLQFGWGDVHVTEARFGRTLRQRGSPPPGLRTIALAAKPGVQFLWRGKQVTGDDIVVFPRGAELSSVSDPHFHVFTCSFPDHLLATTTEAYGAGELDELCGEAEVFRCSSDAIGRVRRCLSDLSRIARENDAVLTDPDFVEPATHDLPRRLLGAIAGSSGSCRSETSRKRELALFRAEAYIEEFAGHDIKVGDICLAAQVSQRTLEYAFSARYGMPPKAFLNTFRLNAVRRELRAANSSSEGVADIANRWSFWHMGQFAADYRDRFGELPSRTLRKAAG
jgi:AraC-like DNA-binding protein